MIVSIVDLKFNVAARKIQNAIIYLMKLERYYLLMGRLFFNCFLILLLPATLLATTGNDESIHGDTGVDSTHAHYSTAFNELIDPFSGSLYLTYTDFRLPGNGGLDLVIHRTYDSKRIYNGPYDYKNKLK